MHFISSFKIYYFTSDRLVRQLLNTAVIVSWLAIDSAEVRARDVTKFVHGNKGGETVSMDPYSVQWQQHNPSIGIQVCTKTSPAASCLSGG